MKTPNPAGGRKSGATVQRIGSSTLARDEIRARANIAQLAQALGCKVRGNRCNAAWRAGKNLSVSLDTSKGVWCDHKTNQGGDVFDLVMVAHGCTFPDALRWLADLYGVPIKPQSRAGLRAYRQQRQRAEQTAKPRARKRRHICVDLVERRNALWDSYGHALRWRLRNSGKRLNDWRWEASLCHAHDLHRGDLLQAELDSLEAMTPTEFREAYA